MLDKGYVVLPHHYTSPGKMPRILTEFVNKYLMEM